MKKFQLLGLSALTLLGSIGAAQAQATTIPVGYTTVSCLPNSDTIVSVPFLNTTDSISSTVSGSATAAGTAPNNTATFTMNGVTGVTANKYQTLHYVRFTSGTLDGNVYQIASNAASAGGNTAVTINLNGDNAASIAAGNKFTIYKFNTLGELFPVGNPTIVQSAGNLGFQRRSQILFPDSVSQGIDLAPNKNFFQTSAGWVDAANLSPANNTLIWPDKYIVIRHPSSVASATTFTPTGTVDTNIKISIPLSTITSGQQDNFIAIPRPIDQKLIDLGLTTNGAFVSSAGNLGFQRRDQLLIFDNTQTAIDKAPIANYFHNGTNWVNSADLSNADNAVVKASQGIIIRKYQTSNGATAFWLNTPSY